MAQMGQQDQSQAWHCMALVSQCQLGEQTYEFDSLTACAQQCLHHERKKCAKQSMLEQAQFCALFRYPNRWHML